MSVRALLLPADTHRYRHDVDKNTSSRISAGLRRSRSILITILIAAICTGALQR